MKKRPRILMEVFSSALILLGLIFVLAGCTSPNFTAASITPTAPVTPTVNVPATLTALFKPTSTPRPTSTPDMRSDFEKCAQSRAPVHYLLYGSATSASVTLQNDTNGTEQAEYLIPFCAPYINFRIGDFVYISAQITSDTGDLTCEIRYNNLTIAKGYASSFANIASCSGVIPGN